MAASASPMLQSLMPQNPIAPNPTTRSRIPAPVNPTPASARTAVRRAAILAMRRGLAAIVQIVRRDSIATTVRKATARRAANFVRARIRAARSAPIHRAAIVRTITAMIAPPAAIAMPARLRVLPRRNSATSGPIPRAMAAARNDPTRRAARVFARTAIGRRVIARSVPGRRVTAIGRAEIRRRQEIFTRRAGSQSRTAQGFRRPWGSRSAQGFRRRSRRFQAVAEARRSWRRRFTPAARRCAQFRQAALRQATLRQTARRPWG